MQPSQRLAELGITLPPVATPAGSYVPALRVGDLIYTSGQVAFLDGQLPATGRLTEDPDHQPTIETAAYCARLCALNALAAAADTAGGIDNIARVVKLTVFVASSKQFTAQPKVANGASDALIEIFGDAGRHARSAVGMAALPLNSPVEVEMIVQVNPGA